jgi:hypothetical protein
MGEVYEVERADTGERSLLGVGVVLYQLVSGHHPFVEDEQIGNKQLVGVAILNRAPRPLREVAPWTPSYLGEITERALAKERGERYADAGEMAMVLASAVRRLEHDFGEIPPLSILRERPSRPPLSIEPADGSERRARRAVTERVPRMDRAESVDMAPRGSRWAGGAEGSDRVVINPAAMGRRRHPFQGHRTST